MAAEAAHSLLEIANKYIRQGWSVFTLHAIRNGHCTCRRKKNCDRAGKHPRGKTGLDEATTDPKALERMLIRHPDSNLAIRTGDGLMVLDVDTGRNGQKTLEALEKKHGPLPKTLMVNTGGGGVHLYFSVEGPMPNSVGTADAGVGPGLDIRGDRGYVVAPPSNHHSGGQYSWVTGSPPRPSEAPEWLLEAARAKKEKHRR
jgi:hypothetical protein